MHGFYASLCTKYPRIVVPPVAEVDNVYIDVTEVAARCWEEACGGGEAAVLEKLQAEISDLVARFGPRKLLYLSCDGVLPQALVHGERCDRFSAYAEAVVKEARSKESTSANDQAVDSDEPHAWDPTARPNGRGRQPRQRATPDSPEPHLDGEDREAADLETRLQFIKKGAWVRTADGTCRLVDRVDREAGTVGFVSRAHRDLLRPHSSPYKQFPEGDEQDSAAIGDVSVSILDVQLPVTRDEEAGGEGRGGGGGLSPGHARFAVTAGAPFADMVNTALGVWAAGMAARSPGLSVYVSNSRAPGDAASKVYNFLRTERDAASSPAAQQGNPTPWYQPNARHLLVSSKDSSLFLALACHEPFFHVVRWQRPMGSVVPSAYMPGTPFTTVAITLLREYLAEEICGKVAKCTELLALRLIRRRFRVAGVSLLAGLAVLRGAGALGRRTVALLLAAFAASVAAAVWASRARRTAAFERLLDDFVLGCRLIGSNATPRLPTLAAPRCAVGTVIDCLVRGYAIGRFTGASDPHLVAVDGTVNLAPLKRLFFYLAHPEAAHLRSQLSGKRFPKEDRAGPLGGPADAACAALYYQAVKAATNCPTALPALPAEMCGALLEALRWDARYFFSPGAASWDSAYPFDYSPTAYSMYTLIDSIGAGSPGNDSSRPVQPLQQMLMLVPPGAHRLLPAEYVNAAAWAPFGYYPETWAADAGAPLLPRAAPLAALHDAHQKVASELLATHTPEAFACGRRAVVPTGAAPGIFAIPPHVPTHAVFRSDLTPGTRCPPVSAFTKAGYIPWHPGDIRSSLSGRRPSFTLLLNFEHRLPSEVYVQSRIRRILGTPATTVAQVGQRQCEVTVPAVDVKKVQDLLEDAGVLPDGEGLILDGQNCKVRYARGANDGGKSVFVTITGLAPPIAVRDVIDHFRSRYGIGVRHVTVSGGTAQFPLDQRHCEKVGSDIAQHDGQLTIRGVRLTATDPRPAAQAEMAKVKAPAFPRFVDLVDFCKYTGVDAVTDWICEVCLTRNYERHAACTQCGKARDPIYSVPSSDRKAKSRYNYYDGDRTRHIVVTRTLFETVLPAPAMTRRSSDASSHRTPGRAG